MSYGLRLRIEYKDINEILTRINIYQDGYSGAADVRFANAGMRIEWGDQGGEGMPLVYGSSCTIYFDAEFDYEFLYLFSADGRKHRVDVEKNNTIFWTGYIEPDGWSEPLITTPYPVQCTAYDGLGFLKDTPFLDASGLAYTGKKTLFDIVKICLLKTGLDLTVNTGIDWVEQLQVAGSDLLKIHRANCDVFDKMSCYDVLEAILRECRIFQRSGKWWIISNTNFYRYTIDYFTTTPDGSTENGSLVSAADGYWFEGQATMQILPALKHLTVIQNFGLNSNILKNGSFEKFNNESNVAENWTATGVVPEQRVLNDDGDKYIYLPGRQKPILWDSQTTCIYSSLPVKTSPSVLKIALKYALMGAEGNSSWMFIKVVLFGSSGTNYVLVRDSNSSTTELILKWNTLLPGPAGYKVMALRSHAYQDKISKLYMENPDSVSAWPASKITDHFETFSETVNGIPEDGLLRIYLFVPYTDSTAILGSAFTGVTVGLMNEEEEEYPETTAYKVTNSERNNYVPEDGELLIGDYPYIANSDIMFKGGLARLDNSHTTGWRQIGTTSYYSFAEFIALIRAAFQKIPRQSYQVRLADMIPTLNMVLWDTNNSDKRLLENGITYDDRMQSVDGRYNELFSLDFTGLVVESATEFDSSTGKAVGKSEKTTIKAKPINAEERVTLIDAAGVKVSSPGYLYDRDFEIKEGQYDDGFIRLQIKKNGISPYNLSPDAGTPQFSLMDAVVECNIDGNPNKVKINAGKLIIHNLKALDKDNRLLALL